MRGGGRAQDRLRAQPRPRAAGLDRVISEPVAAPALLERLRHYFATYKMVPGEPSALIVEDTYGHEEAFQVIRAAAEDYDEEFGGVEQTAELISSGWGD